MTNNNIFRIKVWIVVYFNLDTTLFNNTATGTLNENLKTTKYGFHWQLVYRQHTVYPVSLRLALRAGKIT